MAKELVTGAGRIISWVESILPVEKRRIFFTGDTIYSFNRAATGPDNAETQLWGLKGNLDGMRLTIGDDELNLGS
jgi:hypothetical protein